jgi:hypothetical protein
MNLEYFIASLPMLLPGHPAGITVEAFRTACAEQLSGQLGQAVQALLDDGTSAHPFVQAWENHETLLRNAVARRRAARRGVDAHAWQHPVPGIDVRIDQGVAAAFEQPDPLQRERALVRLRWQAVESLQGYQPLTPEVVLAYAIKLRLLTRWSALDAEAGTARLDALAKLP